MGLNITVNKKSNVPIYRQIIEQITSMTKNQMLKAGDRLPPERELAAATGIARGTIKKAYEELERSKVVEVIRGSGTFISLGQDVLEEGRKEKAIELIDEMLSNLENMKFTHREIDTLIHIRIMERGNIVKKVRIAAIDCNPEALSIFSKQLSYISNVEISKFLLDEIHNYSDVVAIFEEYDILITTSTHYGEVCTMIPKLKEKIMKAAVSPNQQTIIDIATIPYDSAIGVICSSRQFLNIITGRLMSFHINPASIHHIFEDRSADFAEFLRDKDILVIPPGFQKERSNPELLQAIGEFIESGKKVIKFEYQIERGSLIYIEEQISNILKKK